MAPPWTLPLIAPPEWLTRHGEGATERGAEPREARSEGGSEGREEGNRESLVGATEFLTWYADAIHLVLHEFPKAAEYVSEVAGVSEAALSHGLEAFAFVMSATGEYMESTDQTTVGKLVDAGGAGAVPLMMAAINPALPVVDGVVGYAFDHGLGVKGISIESTEKTAWRAITTLGEGIITWDDKGMSQFHEKSMHGEYGPIFKAASEAGEYWADKGIVGGLKEFGSAIADLF